MELAIPVPVVTSKLNLLLCKLLKIEATPVTSESLSKSIDLIALPIPLIADANSFCPLTFQTRFTSLVVFAILSFLYLNLQLFS